MKLESITIENYRQFETADLKFDSGITVLAGANNCGKTSLINLIKNVFNDEKQNYNVSDIPASNMKEWADWGYPVFHDFFITGKTEDDLEKSLIDLIVPEDDLMPSHMMNTTKVKIHVSYNPCDDDIKLFADYIMDLDVDKHDFYFIYEYQLVRMKFLRIIKSNFSKIKGRFKEIENLENKSVNGELDEKGRRNLEIKERYMRQFIVDLYVQSIVAKPYFCDSDYKYLNKFGDIKDFRKLFNFCFIKASRPLDDDESDHSHMLSKQMIKMVKLDDEWNKLIERLPDKLLEPIQEMEIDKTVRDTSLKSLNDTINALEQTNGGKSGELMLDMQVTEDDISELLQRITSATYNVDGYYLGEASQGLGYSNMIYIHLQLKEYEKGINPLKVNMFFLEEPESHMHPQMQQVFIKYLFVNYQSKLQGLVTTHSNEMVRTAGISHLRVIRHDGNFKSKLYDLSVLSNNVSDNELANFYDWFFEIGCSEIVFADKVIFYEGDTERLFIRKAMTLDKYKKLSQQYVAFIQVGGAYAKNYENLIRLLGIKSLIITDIDYEKDKIDVAEIEKSTITNATIKHFYNTTDHNDKPKVSELYSWKNVAKNIFDDLFYICFQTKEDGYARTLEEAMLNKFFSMDVSITYKKSEWQKKKDDSKLNFSIPNQKEKKKLSDNDIISVRDILKSTSGNKTDFMYSVIMNGYEEKMMPKYIEGGLTWLMN